MTPRAPKFSDGRDVILSAAKFLYHHAEEGNDLAEVADMLEDIANGKWTLVNEEAQRRATS